MTTTPIIPKSEKEFNSLKGDFTESVKITFAGEKDDRLNGWYVYERTGKGKNTFVRKTEDSELIQTINCETMYLQFDRNMGVIPNSFYYDYRPKGTRISVEYDLLRKKLENVGEWR